MITGTGSRIRTESSGFTVPPPFAIEHSQHVVVARARADRACRAYETWVLTGGRAVEAGEGLEPPYTESKSAVLPLNEPAIDMVPRAGSDPALSA